MYVLKGLTADSPCVHTYGFCQPSDVRRIDNFFSAIKVLDDCSTAGGFVGISLNVCMFKTCIPMNVHQIFVAHSVVLTEVQGCALS